MAAPTTYFEVKYTGRAGGSFSELGVNVTWAAGASVGFIVSDLVDSITAANGTLKCALVSGSIPTDTQTLAQGGVTATVSGNSTLMLYPAYFRRDVALTSAGDYSWVGPALQVTHSFKFDSQTANVVAGEILTFTVGGQQCEVITVVSDAGATGELNVRWITPIDTLGLPVDGNAYTGSITGDGALDGVVHDRSYSALHVHRLSSDLNDDPFYTGDDINYSTKPIPSGKDTDAIINLLGAVNINDGAIYKHLYGGSIKEGTGATEKLYSGLNVQITDSDGDTEPVLFQNDALIAAWWANALNPNSIQGRIRVMLPTRGDGTDIDGKRVKGKLLRFGDSYFIGATTLGTATTALALFSTPDGNNDTAVGVVSGYTITQTMGYQLINFLNGNGANPFALKIDFAAQTGKETYERTKYNGREGSAETLFGRNAQYFDGINLDFAYDAEVGAGFSEGATAEVVAWGFQLNYGTLAGGTFTIGNVLIGATSGARGRINYDNGSALATVALEGSTPFNAVEVITEYSDGVATGVTAATTSIVNNAAAGTAVLCALYDNGVDGNLYCQQVTGIVPADNQAIFGRTTDTACDVAGTPRTRVVNNQYVGVFTGANFQTNFGICIDPTDAIAGDKFPDMDVPSVIQEPPDTRTAYVTGIAADMFIQILPWDGATYDAVGDPEPDFNEMTVASANITAGVSTTVVVNAMMANTPQTGYLIIQINTTNEYGYWAYTSWTGTTFTMSGTAPFNANIGNTVMRAAKYQLAGATSVSFSAVLGVANQWAIVAKRGGTTTPIKPAKATGTFPFNVNLQPISDA